MSDANARAVASLLRTLENPKVRLRERLAAAEQILSFETPVEIVLRTKKFLISVFETERADTVDRTEAARLVRRAEARKITPQNVQSAADNNRQHALWQDLELASRRLRLDRAGLWPTAVAAGDWGDDILASGYTCPPDGTPIEDLFD